MIMIINFNNNLKKEVESMEKKTQQQWAKEWKSKATGDCSHKETPCDQFRYIICPGIRHFLYSLSYHLLYYQGGHGSIS